MSKIIAAYGVAIPAQGPAGLAIPHLDLGEILEAIWTEGRGLSLLAEQGTAIVQMSAHVMEKYFARDESLQILETDVGKVDRGWLVPLSMSAPAAAPGVR